MKLLNVEEAANYLRISKHMIYVYTSKHKIPFEKIGSRVVFSDEDLDAWIKSKRQGIK